MVLAENKWNHLWRTAEMRKLWISSIGGFMAGGAALVGSGGGCQQDGLQPDLAGGHGKYQFIR